MQGPKSFSGHQTKRILRIAENNPDRANKVLDRMKQRKGLAGDTKITKYGIAYKYTPEETERSSVTVGMKEKPKPLASATTPFKHVSLKSDAMESKPLASGTSASKHVELHSDSKPMVSGSSPFKHVELKSDDNDAKQPLASGTSVVKKVELTTPKLSEEEVTRVSNIKNSARATRVLERMKQRKGISNTKTMMD